MHAKTKIGTLEEILATREKMVFPHRINLPKSNSHSMNEMKEWCTTNCTGLWKGTQIFVQYFQFTESKDAIMFALRWGSR